MFEKIGFIGCGNMATAIVNGIVSQGYIIPKNIIVYDIDNAKTNSLKEGLNVSVADDISSLVKMSDVVFLCVKPQAVCEPLNEINKLDTSNKVLVSIMAGVKIEAINSYFNVDQKIIRVMPNLCLMYSEGASALASYNVNDDEFNFIFNVFNSLGKAIKVEEELLDTVTALSGRGPAFVFNFVKELALSASELGLKSEDALKLAIQTLKGSALVLEQSGKTADELIAMVSSKGGTTVAGLNAMKEEKFDVAVKAAVTAAHNRSKELSNLK